MHICVCARVYVYVCVLMCKRWCACVRVCACVACTKEKERVCALPTAATLKSADNLLFCLFS